MQIPIIRIHPWKTHLARTCPGRGCARCDGCASFGAVWNTLELNHNSGYVSRVTPSHKHNDTGACANAVLLTYWMAKFYYSYEHDLRNRNAPLVTEHVIRRLGGLAAQRFGGERRRRHSNDTAPFETVRLYRQPVAILSLIIKCYWGD